MELIKKLKNFRLNLIFCFISIIVFSFLLTLLALWIQPISISDVMRCVKENNGTNLFLNYLPVLLLTLTLFFMTSNLVSSFSLSGLIVLFMSFVNRNKILLRNDPFLPWDISLGFEVAGIAKSFGAKMIAVVLIAIIIYILLSVLAYLIIKNEKLKIKFRIIGTFVCILIIFLCNKPLYKNQSLNADLFVIGNVYNQVNTFNSKGFLYSFLYALNTNKISKPDNYKPDAVEEKIDSFEEPDLSYLKEKKKPHLFIIMGEAFSEMSLNPNFNFEGYTDPLENYKIIKENAIHGQILVPNLGGGTADTEFDVLTGLTTRHLRGAPFSYRLIKDDFEALPSVLKKIGYYSEAMHPGYEWFYNRQNVFKHFGFDAAYFIEEFNPDEQNKGMYINETATIDKLIQLFENHLENNENTPYLNFTVTIQNHGPYKDKYLVDPNFSTPLDISSDDINAISNYFEGVKDADRELMRLVNYMEESDEPIVLLYFGDHLPAFSQDVYNAYYENIYEEGTKESFQRLYRTPFIIYENKASKAISSIEENYKSAQMPEDMIISTNYLGGYFMELLGYDELSPFFSYENSLRGKYPVILEQKSFTANGNDTLDMTEEEKQDLILFRDWEFYKIFP